jgi:HSP20 family protein
MAIGQHTLLLPWHKSFVYTINQFAVMKTQIIFKTGDHAVLRTFCGSFSDMDHLNEELHAENKPVTRPAINIAETAKEYILELALPGYQKNDLHLEIEDDVLIIQASSSSVPSHYKEVRRFYKREFMPESFTRTFLLPEDVDRASASFGQGILSIRLTKGSVRILPVNGPCYSEIILIH